MSLRILQRTRARQDVLEITAYIADRNPQAAERVFAAYERSLTGLARNPDIGWLYPTDNPKLARLRAFPIGRFRTYLIFYRHTDDTLEVIRVLHGRRDLATLLRQEETTPSLRGSARAGKEIRRNQTRFGRDRKRD